MSKVRKQKKEPTPTHRALKLHVWLKGLSPMIWRRLLISEDDSLGDLHYAIQIAFGWDDSHLNRFNIHGRDYGICHIGGLVFADAGKAKLSEFSFRRNEKFLYEYDFHVPWEHTIRVEEILPINKNEHPTCLAGEGLAPPEDCGGQEGFRELQEQYSYSYIASRTIDIMDQLINHHEIPSREEVDLIHRWNDPRKIDLDQINKDLRLFVEENSLGINKERSNGNSDSIIDQI